MFSYQQKIKGTSSLTQSRPIYANISMPQNTAGWLVRWLRSMLLIRSMSSLVSSKSETLMFSSSRSSFDDFGMTTVFRWIPHRRTIWATVFLYFSAKPWNHGIKGQNRLDTLEFLKAFIFFCHKIRRIQSFNLLWEWDRPNMTQNQTIRC